MNSKSKSLLTFLILLIVIPAFVIGGSIIFREKHYSFIAVCIAILSCLPLFYAFERKNTTSKELTVLAVMIAFSVIGRFIFAFIPGFKPVTAITIICAVWLGKEAGFVVGSLSAIVSNMYFGQGPWTPFQMFTWGLIGFLAGILSKPLQKSRILLCVYGAFSGIVYSAILDLWSTLWADNYINIARYLTTFISSLPATIEYVVSNIIFLLLLNRPFGKKLKRLKVKYGMFKI